MYYYTRRLLCKNHQSRDLEDKTSILLQEIIKLFTGQISSLKRLYLEIGSSCSSFNTLTIYPRANDCLKNLSELHCYSSRDSELIYQLSQICHNLLSLTIMFKIDGIISNGLVDLISVQKNLKYLYIDICCNLSEMVITSLTKLPSTLTKLSIHGKYYHMPLSFITGLTNLQKLKLSFEHNNSFKDFSLVGIN